MALLCLIVIAVTSAQKGKNNKKAGGSPETIYVLANDPTPGGNAVLAYRHDPATGCLDLVGTYPTGGTGNLNITDRLGPDDHDQAIIASPDGKFVFAVNQGSNTVAVFRVKPYGGLTPVKGSPFHSGGNGPVSLSLAGDTLYVVNQNENTEDPSTTGNPNYTALRLTRTAG
jgi:6-phosphogluconolactonase (cycloisomerase 2 family)